MKLLVDNTSSFCNVKDKNDNVKDLTHDLSLISKWAFRLKKLFNPDPTEASQKQSSQEKDDSAHPNIFFNDIPVETVSHQKHLEIHLDDKLNFKCILKLS